MIRQYFLLETFERVEVKGEYKAFSAKIIYDRDLARQRRDHDPKKAIRMEWEVMGGTYR